MSAWKSSDGGAISMLGGSRYAGAPGAGLITLVSGASNTRGVILRTAVIYTLAANSDGWVAAGGHVLLGGRMTGTGAQVYHHLTQEIFVEAGNAVTFNSVSGSPSFYITYDIL